MSRKILVAYGEQDQSHDALKLARILARIEGAELVVAHIHPLDIYSPVPELHRYAREFVEKDLAEQMGPAAKDVEVIVTAATTTAAGLMTVCGDVMPDVVVLGSSHRGRLRRVGLGNIAQRLLNGSPCGVVVAPKGYVEPRLHDREAGLAQIAVAYDGSPEAQVAVEAAESLALENDAQLTVIGAVAPVALPFYYYPPIESARLDREAVAAMQTKLDQVVADLDDRVSPKSRILQGEAGAVFSEEIGPDTNLLVMGSRRYGQLRRVLLGSTSATLMADAPCPVMVVPRPAIEPEEKDTEPLLAAG